MMASLSLGPLKFSVVNVLNVLREVHFSSAHWKSLGRRLKPSLDLDAIQENNTSVEECLVKVIEQWKRDGDGPSWMTLAEAVSKCNGGGRNVAGEILIRAGLEFVLDVSLEAVFSSADWKSLGSGRNVAREIPICARLEFTVTNVLDVFREADVSSADWKSLGMQLKPSLKCNIDLDAIQANNSTSVEECLVKVIEQLQRDGDGPFWIILAEAVSKCHGGGRNIAREILIRAGQEPPLQCQEESRMVRDGSENSVNKEKTDRTRRSVDPILRVKASFVGVARHHILKLVLMKPSIGLLRYWKTSLTTAAENGNLNEVLELLESGAEPNPHRISTPLKAACSNGDRQIAEVLLKAGADPNLVTGNWNPLLEASALGNKDMIKLLLDSGANPNAVNVENTTALMVASNHGHYGAVDLLLSYGADPNMQDFSGWSALMGAVHNHREDVALRLIEAGANPHLQNFASRSALRLAMESNQDKVVDAFLDRHPDLKPGLRGDEEIDWSDGYDETDLLFACKKKSWRVAKRILCKGGNPNLSNRDGETPLLTAIGYENIDMVEQLLNANADPNMRTVLGHPLQLASCLSNENIIVLLEQHGAMCMEAKLPEIGHWISCLLKCTLSKKDIKNLMSP
jgi:ankyrin repeat protein